MNEKLKTITTTVKEKWTDLSKVMKILLISVPIAIIAIIIVLVILLNQKSSAVLFSGVEDEEAGTIAAAIQALGITDVTVNGDGDIIVPEEQVDYLRMQMYMQGYPTSSTDYEIWNNGVDLWSTDSDKREVKRQQLETRIAAALATLDSVKDATVLLNMPEVSDYVIVTDKGVTSCSVILNLKPNYELSNAEVRAMYRAVTASVENLTNDNVSIMDTTGQSYEWVDPSLDDLPDVDESGVDIARRRQEFQKEFVAALEDGLGDMLDTVYGKGNYAFNVAAILDYDKRTTTSEEYFPSPESENNSGVLGHGVQIGEGGNLAADAGLVGTTPNGDLSPDYPTYDYLEDGQTYYYNKTEMEYYVTNIKEEIIKDGYEIERLSVGLMINENEMSETEREAMEELVAMAAGTTVDNVSVYNTTFALTNPIGNGGTTIGGDNIIIPTTPVDSYRDLLLFVVVGLGILLIVLLIMSLFMSHSRKKKIKSRQLSAAQAAANGAAGYGTAQPETVEEIDFNIASLTEEAGKDSRETILKREISDFSQSSPEIVASIIKNMLREE